MMNLYGTLYWEITLCQSVVCLYILQVRRDCSLFQTIFSWMFVEQMTLGDRDTISLRTKGQVCFLLITTDSGSLNSGILSCKATHRVCKYQLALSALPCGRWGLGYWHENAAPLAIACVGFLLLLLKKLPQY